MLSGEARRATSILRQTPGWLWIRELCVTERSQQCQSGPTTKAWRRLPARQHRRGTCGEHCRSCMEMGGAWVAMPISIVRARTEATLGRVCIAPLKLDRPIVRPLPVHNDGGVSRRKHVSCRWETTCELLMTRTNRSSVLQYHPLCTQSKRV